MRRPRPCPPWHISALREGSGSVVGVTDRKATTQVGSLQGSGAPGVPAVIPRRSSPGVAAVGTTMDSALTHLACSRTGERYDADVVQGLSRAGAPLLPCYDIERAGRTLTREALAERPPTLWRYREMLPVRNADHVITLGE